MKEFNERLQQIIDSLGISVNRFSKEICANESTIRKILLENTSMTSGNLRKIANKYPEFNIDWLVTGRGSMYYDTLESNQYTAERGDIQQITDLYERMLKEREERIFELERRINSQCEKIDILVASYTRVVEGVVLK